MSNLNLKEYENNQDKIVGKLPQNMMNNQHLNKKTNQIYRSQYFPTSHFVDENPEVFHSYFHDKPFEKYENDRSKLRPVSYQPPSQVPPSRHFIILDQQVKYGQPISAEEFQRMILKKKQEPEIVTYGIKSEVRDKLQSGVPQRIKVDVECEKEKEEKACCWCCAANTQLGDDLIVGKI